MKLHEELKEVEFELSKEVNYTDEVAFYMISSTPRRHSEASMRKEYSRLRALYARRDALRLTIRRLNRRLKARALTRAWTEAEPVDDTSPVTTVDQYQNFEDIAGAEVDYKSSPPADTLSTGQNNTLFLGDFLARPLKIAQTEVLVDGDLEMVIDVWDEFTSHPTVRAKLRNYAYFSGELKLRVTVSGTPWHFGKIQASYQPLAGFNDNLTVLEPLLSGAHRYVALTYLSQAKGCTTIDVHDNKPYEFTCPFISPQPMLRLFDKSPLILPAASPFSDCVGFGKLYLNTISPLRAVGTTATPVGIQVYAWMENVQLGAPTGTVIEIDTEGDSDERVKGPVETISSGAANIADQAAGLPVIGPYAKAASAPLRLVSKIASLFGFSYPTTINPPERVKNEPFQNSANLIGMDTGQRLTLDPRQELSVDPSSTGTNIDEMSISYLCSVESLLDTFQWTTEDGQMASSIWMVPVNPNLSRRSLVTVGPPELYLVPPTPMGYASMPFEWWRGDITFRFEIVCSQFHRGTLAVLFEPNISQNVVIDTSLDLNKQFIKKIDLQSTKDFEVTIEWAYPRPWARIMPPSLFEDIGGVGFLGDQLFDYANGYIAVTPYTALQSPDDSPITINVYIKSDNMTFNQLTCVNLPTARPDVEGEMHTPHDVDHSVLNDSTAKEDNIASLTFGETPVSFRAALKRFAGWYDNSNVSFRGTASSASATTVRLRCPIIPKPAPSYSNAASSTPSLYGYLRYAYLGMRGGIKYRVAFNGPVQLGTLDNVLVTLMAPESSYPVVGTAYDSDVQTLSCNYKGSAQFVPFTNGGIEFECPLYTPNLFLISFTETALSGTDLMDDYFTKAFQVNIPTRPLTASANDPVRFVTTTAIGEDFSFMRFSGSPIYQYSVP